MKRLAAILVTLSMGLFLGLSATAQTPSTTDKQVLNHLAIGVSAGLDGLGGQIALPLGSHVQIRAGYSLVFPKTINPISVDASKLPSDVVSKFNIPTDKSIDITPSTNFSTGRALLDFFPTKKGGFHLTVGAHFGGADYLSFRTSPLPVDPGEYATTYIEINGAKVGTDANGVIALDVIVPKVNPYVGIGFGRAISSKPRKFATLTLDLGALYTGGKHSLQTYDINGNPVELNGQSIKSLVGNSINETIIDVLDKAADFPVIPMARLTINVKLF